MLQGGELVQTEMHKHQQKQALDIEHNNNDKMQFFGEVEVFESVNPKQIFIKLRIFLRRYYIFFKLELFLQI